MLRIFSFTIWTTELTFPSHSPSGLATPPADPPSTRLGNGLRFDSGLCAFGGRRDGADPERDGGGSMEGEGEAVAGAELRREGEYTAEGVKRGE